MTGVLLVCILPAGALPGMDVAPGAAQPLTGLTLRSLTFWTRPAPHAPAPTLEDVRAHHEIVEAAWSAFPAVLPVRFGQWFAAPADLLAAAEPRIGEYERALERVEGCGEFSHRLLESGAREGEDPAPVAAAPPAEHRGTAYLLAAAARARLRAAVDERGRAVAGEMRAALGRLVREERVEPLATPHGLATVAHLVARTDEEAYRAAADRFAADAVGLRLLRTGPWPAWSFT